MAKKKKKRKSKKKDTRLDLLREQKILRAKEKVSGELEQRDAERLVWLDAELTKPPPLPADEKATARMPAFKGKTSRKESATEEEEPAQEPPPAEEEDLDEKAARKKRLEEARRKDRERKRQAELEKRVAEEERRRQETERARRRAEDGELPPEEEEEPTPEEEEPTPEEEEPPLEEEEASPESEEEPLPEEEEPLPEQEELPPEEEEELPPEEEAEAAPAEAWTPAEAAPDGWDDEDTDPGVEPPAAEEVEPGAEEERAALADTSDGIQDMSDDVPDMSDDVPDMSDDVPDMSDDVPDMSDDVPDMSDEEPTGPPPEEERTERPGANLAPPDEFDDLAGSGPAGIFKQPTAVKPPEEPAPDPPGASVMVDPTLFDDETVQRKPDAGLLRDGVDAEEKTPVPGPGPGDELAQAMAAAEAGIDEEDPEVAESRARADAFERAQGDKKRTLKMQAMAKPEPEPAAEEPEPEPEEVSLEVQVEVEDAPEPEAEAPQPSLPEISHRDSPLPPGGAFALGDEADQEPEDDLDVGAALEAGAQAGVDPGPSGGLSESALFTESVVMDMSDITGAKAISLGEDKAGEDLKQNDLTGPRQAVVKMTTGLSRSGSVAEPDLNADALELAAPGGKGDKPSAIPIKKIRIVQLMLPSGLARPLPTGAQVNVILKDGTRLTGFTPDRSQGCRAFTLFPEKDRFIERVIVYTHAVKEVLTKS